MTETRHPNHWVVDFDADPPQVLAPLKSLPPTVETVLVFINGEDHYLESGNWDCYD